MLLLQEQDSFHVKATLDCIYIRKKVLRDHWRLHGQLEPKRIQNKNVKFLPKKFEENHHREGRIFFEKSIENLKHSKENHSVVFLLRTNTN